MLMEELGLKCLLLPKVAYVYLVYCIRSGCLQSLLPSFGLELIEKPLN